MKRYSDILAKAVRVATIPPIMVMALLLISYGLRREIYRSAGQLWVSLLFLMGIPMTAYPLAAVLPKYRTQGREGQRNLAFVMNALGYVGVVVWGAAARVSGLLMRVYLTYFLSVLALLLFNKALGLRASGHACSIAGPLILLVDLLGWGALVPCGVVFGAVVWSSLHIKRHTPRELLWGTACAGVAFFLSLLIVRV